MSSNRLVYSTSGDNTCSRCGKALIKCRCTNNSNVDSANSDGIVRIHRETKGRGGKEVTVIAGIPLSGDELKKVAKAIKAAAGSGGSIKNGEIEIQGDKRDIARNFLQARGFTVKLSGG